MDLFQRIRLKRLYTKIVYSPPPGYYNIIPHKMLRVNNFLKKYFCLHDDHSYILGNEYLSSNGISKTFSVSEVYWISSNKLFL